MKRHKLNGRHVNNNEHIDKMQYMVHVHGVCLLLNTVIQCEWMFSDKQQIKGMLFLIITANRVK